MDKIRWFIGFPRLITSNVCFGGVGLRATDSRDRRSCSNWKVIVCWYPTTYISCHGSGRALGKKSSECSENDAKRDDSFLSSVLLGEMRRLINSKFGIEKIVM